MSKYRYLVITDLDGTLLNNQGRVSQNSIDYVKKLHKRGDVMFTFSSGRCWRDAEQIYKELDIQGFASCCNGAFIYDPHQNLTHYSFISEKLYEEILSNDELFTDLSKGDVLSDKGNFSLTPTVDRKEIISKLKEIGANVFCLKIYFKCPTKVDEIKEEFNSKLIFLKNLESRPYVTVFYYPGVINVEIQANYVSKERTVEILGNYYGVPYENILTFGDQVNDLGAMAGKSRSTAVRNAIDLIKQAAKRISPYRNDEDAVIKEVDLFLKGKETR